MLTLFVLIVASLRVVELAQTLSKTKHSLPVYKEWLNSSQLEIGTEWIAWRQTHGKNYASRVHELERYIVWRSNRQYIEQHNRYAHKFGYSLEMNQYGDLTSSEYADAVQCIDTVYPYTSKLHLNETKSTQGSLPNRIDWRERNAVTKVKNQGRCRSCYAFAVTGALEGVHAVSSGKLVPLSEQNIIDCSVPYGNRGCSGGSRMASFTYILDNEGIDSEESYPYAARQYLCRYSAASSAASCVGMVDVKKGDESELKKAVAENGPVTVAIDSRHSSFQFYSGGIYSEPSCSSTTLTHTMLVVGYGTNSNGKDYWIVKNSWGTAWGDDGYIKIIRNYGNQCGIASSAMFPIIL